MTAVLIATSLVLSAAAADDAAFDVAVVSFRTAGASGGDAWQGVAVAELVSGALEGVDKAVAPRENVQKAEGLAEPKPGRSWRTADAAEVGRLTLARLVITGSLSAAGGGFAVQCALVQTAHKKQLDRCAFEAPDVFAAAEGVLRFVEPHLPGARAARPPTRDPLALELYCWAMAGKPDEQRAELLEGAVEADGSFARALEELGRAQARLGKYAEARLAFARLADLPGHREEADLLTGWVYEKHGQLIEARRLYEQARANRRLAARAWCRLGRLAEDAGELERAEAAYREALAADRFCAPAANSLGVIARRRDNPDRAAEHYRQAAAADPLWAAPHYNLAMLMEDRGNVRGAVEQLGEAIKLAPDEPRYHEQIATLLAGQWRYDAAIEHARRAVALAPTNASARQTLGAVYYHAGKPEDARRELEKSLELDPQLARTHYTVGLTHQYQGNLELAAASYRRALQIDPKLADCEAALDRCEAMLQSEKERSRRAFACASLRDDAAWPGEVAGLVVLCAIPALWWRAHSAGQKRTPCTC